MLKESRPQLLSCKHHDANPPSHLYPKSKIPNRHPTTPPSLLLDPKITLLQLHPLNLIPNGQHPMIPLDPTPRPEHHTPPLTPQLSNPLKLRALPLLPLLLP